MTIVGSSLSAIVTVCVEVAVNPAPSVTVHVTEFDPNDKLAGLAITLATLQLSFVSGAVNWLLSYVQTPASESKVISPKVAIVGSVTSTKPANSLPPKPVIS